MIIFKNHQLKIYFLNFWIICFIYLISISQISSKNLQKTILSKNIISNLLNNTNDEKKIKKKNK